RDKGLTIRNCNNLTTNLKALLTNAKNAGLTLYLNSAYRPYSWQEDKCGTVKPDGTCSNGQYAPAGKSEHQLGIAVDFSNAPGVLVPAGSAEYNWLVENAGKYGFKCSYCNGGTYGTESWHYRFENPSATPPGNDPPPPTPQPQPDLVPPLDGRYEVSSRFGERILNGECDMHEGIDLRRTGGRTVRSIAAGKIERITSDCAGDNIEIYHPGLNLYSYYYHIDYYHGIDGNNITAGQEIGTVHIDDDGCTENGIIKSTGTHLHFGLSTSHLGGYINPCSYERANEIRSWKGDECRQTVDLPQCNLSLSSTNSSIKGSVSGNQSNSQDRSLVSNVTASEDYPVSNAKLTFEDRLFENKYTTYTDSSGNFDLDVPADIYTMTVEKDSFKTYKQTIELGSQKTYNVSVLLESGNQQEYGGFSNLEEIAVNFEVNRGWNLITLNVVPDQGDYYASDFLEDALATHSFITRIMCYKNGRWEIYQYGDNKNKDFRLILGEGYVLKSDKAGEFTINGTKVDKPVPVKISTGWNLVGIPYSENGYTAVGVIDSANSSGGQVDTVTKWESKWVNVIKEEGLVFGHDFRINNQAGYFIRSRNLVYWTPG
ncbi:MAG: D-alanyl-D-alanine carboxypeptidase family protein, partial [Candidatus Dojkabacteria bacterium]|nr:D-alanyl-D-alanine carboxypeptidase family protein [Candidatus Dojkabacteria bacterium]